MQWIPGIKADNAYKTLAADARVANAFGIEIQVCLLANLREMKRMARPPQTNLQDLAELDSAHPNEE